MRLSVYCVCALAVTLCVRWGVLAYEARSIYCRKAADAKAYAECIRVWSWSTADGGEGPSSDQRNQFNIYWEESTGLRGAYKPHVYVSGCVADARLDVNKGCCHTNYRSDFAQRKSGAHALLTAKRPRHDDDGFGRVQYWTGNSDPWDAQVHLDSGVVVPVITRWAFERPRTWGFWHRVYDGGVGTWSPWYAEYNRFAYTDLADFSGWGFYTVGDGGKSAPDITPGKATLQSYQCDVSVDVCASANHATGDCSCVHNKVTSAWADNYGDRVDICTTDGRLGNYGMNPPPPFWPYKAMHTEKRRFLMPATVNITVPNGYYHLALPPYSTLDPAFAGLDEAYTPPDQPIPCPPGTWMTCTSALDNDDARPNACGYPAAVQGQSYTSWAAVLKRHNAANVFASRPVAVFAQRKRAAYEDTVPGVNGATCYPCVLAQGKSHFGTPILLELEATLQANATSFYCPGGIAIPTPCSYPRVNPFNPTTGVGMGTSCVCPPGYYSPDGLATGDGACAMCPAGSFCGMSRFVDAAGSTCSTKDAGPQVCPSGTFSAAGAAVCTPCKTNEDAQCGKTKRLTKCDQMSDEPRTRFQTRDARCVGCGDCRSQDKPDLQPCWG